MTVTTHAFPVDHHQKEHGMTTREYFALHLMAAALAGGRDATPEEFAKTALERAAALISALAAKAPH